MHTIYVFSCENSGLIPAIFIHKLENNNSGVSFQARIIPVKCDVGSLNYPSSFIFRVIFPISF